MFSNINSKFLYFTVATPGYYNAVKQAAKMNIPGAKAIFEDLSKRFAKARSGNGNTPEPVA